MATRDITFEIQRHIAVLKEGTGGWTMELNLVSWNGASPKYDIRFWNEDHDRMMRGLTFDKEIAGELTKALNKEFFPERDDRQPEERLPEKEKGAR